MKIPKPPWYSWVDKKLESVEGLTDVVLLGIIVISVFLLIKGDRVAKTAWVVYVISP